MADTYAVVQKRGAAGGTRVRSGVDVDVDVDVDSLYSRVARRGRGPPAPAQDPLGTQPCGGFNLRIGKPKGPRDPPAEWTRV